MANRVSDSAGPSRSSWLAPLLAAGALVAAALSTVRSLRLGALIVALTLGAGATLLASTNALADRKRRERAGVDEARSDIALAEARRQVQLLEHILDETEEGVMLVDRSAAVQLANASARRILGLGSGATSPMLDAIGLTLLVARAMRIGAPISEEREVHLPSRRTLSLRASPFEAGALVLVSDMTAARRLEGIRKEFAANVSHELKTPVAGIGLIAEQLGHAMSEDPAAATRFADQLAAETERLGNLVRDLLDLNRIESDVPLVVTEVDAFDIAADVVERMRALADAKQITLTLDGSAARFRADASQVATALTNLVDNAVRYSPLAAEVRIKVARKVDHVWFVVEDDGPGIPSNEIGRIFERFYRVDKARARATGGTGLGLAIVKHVVERHGGRVEAFSDSGHGSTFTLVLPVQPEDSQ
jgi:signal transduction histidine kinase